MLDQSAVVQEASQIHGFIESVIHLCSDLREDYPVFSNASLSFFRYVLKLGQSTQTYLEGFPAFYLKSDDDRAARSKLQKLYSLKTSWEALHAYVKPALDADSLHLPSSLVTAFEDIVNRILDWENYKFVLFHTAEANYLQIPSGMARDVANEIADSVGFERFDPNLGLVGIPYSQSGTIFLNCILPHEFAHFIYQEYSNDDVEAQIDISASSLARLDSDDFTWCLGEIKSWVQETFCDLLAVCMIGPAFSLSLVRLIAANSLVGRDDGEPGDAYAFKDGYPADAARLHLQKKLLDRLGWWPLLNDWRCSSIQAINKCADWSDFIIVEGKLPEGVSSDDLLAPYREICEWLVEYCAGLFVGVDEIVASYKAQAPEICKYLERAIVPSTILIDGNEQYPSPVVLLNAGLRFLLEDLPDLINNIAGRDPKSVATHSEVGRRVELWILKAIEDHRLLTRQEA